MDEFQNPLMPDPSDMMDDESLLDLTPGAPLQTGQDPKSGHAVSGQTYVGTGAHEMTQYLPYAGLLMGDSHEYLYNDTDAVNAKQILQGIQQNAYQNGESVQSYISSLQGQLGGSHGLAEYNNQNFQQFNATQLKIFENHADEIIRDGYLSKSSLGKGEFNTLMPQFQGNNVLNFSNQQQQSLIDFKQWQREEKSFDRYTNNILTDLNNTYTQNEKALLNQIRKGNVQCSDGLLQAVKNNTPFNNSVNDEFHDLLNRRFFDDSKNRELTGKIVAGMHSVRSTESKIYKVKGDNIVNGERVEYSSNLARTLSGRKLVNTGLKGDFVGNELVNARNKAFAAREVVAEVRTLYDKAQLNAANNRLLDPKHLQEQQNLGVTLNQLRAEKQNAADILKTRKQMESARRRGVRFSASENGTPGYFDARERLKDLSRERKNLAKQRAQQVQGHQLSKLQKTDPVKAAKKQADLQKHSQRKQMLANSRFGQKVTKAKNAAQKTAQGLRAAQAKAAAAKAAMKKKMLNTAAGKAVGKVAAKVTKAAAAVHSAVASALAAALPWILLILLIILIVIMLIALIATLCSMLVSVFWGGSNLNKTDSMENGFYQEYYQDVLDALYQYEFDFITERQELGKTLAEKQKGDTKFIKCVRPDAVRGVELEVLNSQVRSIIDEYGNMSNDMGVYAQLLYMSKVRVCEMIDENWVTPLTNYVTYMWGGDEDNEYVKNLASKYKGVSGCNHQLIVQEDESKYMYNKQQIYKDHTPFTTYWNGELKGKDSDNHDAVFSVAIINHGDMTEGVLPLCHNKCYHTDQPGVYQKVRQMYTFTTDAAGNVLSGTKPEAAGCNFCEVGLPRREQTSGAETPDDPNDDTFIYVYNWQCKGHCAGHMQPLLDFWYLADIENLCKVDTKGIGDEPAVWKISATMSKWFSSGVGQVADKILTAFMDPTSRAYYEQSKQAVMNTGELALQFSNDAFVSWNEEGKDIYESWHDNEQIKILEDLSDTYEHHYQRGIEYAKDLNITIIQGRSCVYLNAVELANLEAALDFEGFAEMYGANGANGVAFMEQVLSGVDPKWSQYVPGSSDCSGLMDAYARAMGYTGPKLLAAGWASRGAAWTSPTQTVPNGAIVARANKPGESTWATGHCGAVFYNNATGMYSFFESTGNSKTHAGGARVVEHPAEWFIQRGYKIVPMG